MCVSPARLPDNTEIPCRSCWQCHANRINDLVGRCMAEQATSCQSFSVTLTYAGDTPNAAVLCYRDIQLFLKRLRKNGYSVRYIVAGEYGTKKGRAHWHIVLFLRGKTLDIVEAGKRENDWQVVLPRFDDDPAARIQFAPWSDPAEGRGFAYFQSPDYGGFRYAMKYALKQQGNDSAHKALGMSKKPPLGHDFFMSMADDLVERQLPVQLPTYSFRGELDAKGKHRKFCLQGRMREMFLDRYQICWRLVHGSEPPASDWYAEQYLDKIARALDERDPTARRLERVAALSEITPAWVPEVIWFHTFVHKGRECAITVDGNVASIDLGKGRPWRVEKAERLLLERQLLRTGLKESALMRVCEWLLFYWTPKRLVLTWRD